jgi:hypothetical protein
MPERQGGRPPESLKVDQMDKTIDKGSIEQQIELDRERVESERERVEDDREKVEADRERLEHEREGHGHRPPHYEIFIDKDRFEVEEPDLIGAQLRELPKPPVGQDRDLWEEIPGPGDDKKIGDEEHVRMRSGLRFFTTPRHVTPGATDAPAR